MEHHEKQYQLIRKQKPDHMKRTLGAFFALTSLLASSACSSPSPSNPGILTEGVVPSMSILGLFCILFELKSLRNSNGSWKRRIDAARGTGDQSPTKSAGKWMVIPRDGTGKGMVVWYQYH
jgi:hypothetical protein